MNQATIITAKELAKLRASHAELLTTSRDVIEAYNGSRSAVSGQIFYESVMMLAAALKRAEAVQK